ncbi:sigma-70 RNA polymerase sigma factor region 4 domain-containing protein [Actinacidiphila glaucinigra]|uniref:RNA polymerase sigma factor, sigma-70 family n=1 Tax=Actinacidiphila glaucinigra TaxID=235986 RepID=A0A239NKV6_9ACTN|nr:sigma-70 family RNA polymerase sigma factor [Actinacidiphila glaucinigra]SNT55222.1 RNA polymerase sigma factor, sigma-70 family [Actinacidiphila glaucinigra]
MTPRVRHEELTAIRPLLAAEAAAESVPACVEAADLEQSVWLRLLELPEPPPDPARWLRRAVRAEVRLAVRRARRETPYGPGRHLAAEALPSTEQQVLAAEQRRTLLAAARRLPGRCPELVSALISRSDPTYREISRELGISQGSLGPMRSRCLSCLRTILATGVASPVRRGNAP